MFFAMLVADGLPRHAVAETMAISPISMMLPSSTVAGLPACNAATTGLSYIVTDALTPIALATVAGSGAVKVPVICNGSNYIVG